MYIKEAQYEGKYAVFYKGDFISLYTLDELEEHCSERYREELVLFKYDSTIPSSDDCDNYDEEEFDYDDDDDDDEYSF